MYATMLFVWIIAMTTRALSFALNASRCVKKNIKERRPLVNKTEREILYRMHCLLTAIPLPIAGGGTQSASMAGFVSFGQDMAEMRPKIDAAWGLFNFKEYDECKVLLSAIEAWVAMRSEQQWELQASLFRKEIEHFKKEIELKQEGTTDATINADVR
jgi:hypothetical protein